MTDKESDQLWMTAFDRGKAHALDQAAEQIKALPRHLAADPFDPYTTVRVHDVLDVLAGMRGDE